VTAGSGQVSSFGLKLVSFKLPDFHQAAGAVWVAADGGFIGQEAAVVTAEGPAAVDADADRGVPAVKEPVADIPADLVCGPETHLTR
jgi:hypothetical protein